MKATVSAIAAAISPMCHLMRAVVVSGVGAIGNCMKESSGGRFENGAEGSPPLRPYWGAPTVTEVAKMLASSQSARQMQRSGRVSRFRVTRGGLAWNDEVSAAAKQKPNKAPTGEPWVTLTS